MYSAFFLFLLFFCGSLRIKYISFHVQSVGCWLDEGASIIHKKKKLIPYHETHNLQSGHLDDMQLLENLFNNHIMHSHSS
jgi:hypothetical protein